MNRIKTQSHTRPSATIECERRSECYRIVQFYEKIHSNAFNNCRTIELIDEKEYEILLGS